jgi:uncharacterized protein involved in type VI secretion and phage assembly
MAAATEPVGVGPVGVGPVGVGPAGTGSMGNGSVGPEGAACERVGHEPVAGERLPAGLGEPFYGVHVGIVVDVQDPEHQGRVRVRLPWAVDGDRRYEAWARVATLMAGAGRGSWFIPDVDDEVLLAFEAGDPHRPYVLGSLWNGKDQPPEQMGAGNDVRTIRTRSGVTIRMSDAPRNAALTLETPGGQQIVLSDEPDTIVVSDANGNQVVVRPQGIEVTAATTVAVKAPRVELAAGMVTVDAGMSRFSGVVQADTVITNTVVAATYTPGAGNVW